MTATTSPSWRRWSILFLFFLFVNGLTVLLCQSQRWSLFLQTASAYRIWVSAAPYVVRLANSTSAAWTKLLDGAQHNNGTIPNVVGELNVHIDLTLLVVVHVVIAAWCLLPFPRSKPSATPVPDTEDALDKPSDAAITTALPAKTVGLRDDFAVEELRMFVNWLREPEDNERLVKHECPVCHDVIMQPKSTKCQHHACGSCLRSLVERGVKKCPVCKVEIDLATLELPIDSIAESNGRLRCSCKGCNDWEGILSDFYLHSHRCSGVQGSLRLRHYEMAVAADKARVQGAGFFTMDRIYKHMAGASPALIHRYPPCCFKGEETERWSPIFSACGRTWRMALKYVRSSDTCFLGIAPRNHTDRLRCTLVFGSPNERYKERRVQDWPADRAGQLWGPMLKGEELVSCRQADGSLLVMIHAHGLDSSSPRRRFST